MSDEQKTGQREKYNVNCMAYRKLY